MENELKEVLAAMARVTSSPGFRDDFAAAVEASKFPEKDTARKEDLQREVEELKAEARALCAPAGATPLPVPPVGSGDSLMGNNPMEAGPSEMGIGKLAVHQARSLCDALDRGEKIGVRISHGELVFFAVDRSAWERALGTDKLRERMLADPSALWE